MPAIGTQRGKRARKPTLDISKVVADVARQADAARQRKQSRIAAPQYASQATAVKRVATRQRQAAVTRQALAAERGYRSQGRAVKLAADPHARRVAAHAAELRQMRARSRAQERSYRSLANQVNVAAQLQSRVGRIQRRAQATTAEPVRALGVRIPGQKARPLIAPDASKRVKGETRAFSAVGKTSAELAELIARVDKKDPHKFDRAVRNLRGEAGVKASQELSGPARKVLSVATRPLNVTAGATSAALRGKSAREVAKAGWKGLTSNKEKDRKLFSTVLKEQGVKGPVGSALGFALDIGLDPLTYVSMGRSTVAREAALKESMAAARAAERKALSAGATKVEARLRGIDAQKAKLAQASKAARPARHQAAGFDVRFAGKRVPVITRATGAATHIVGKAPTPKTVAKIKIAARKGAGDVNAMLRAVEPTTGKVQTRATQATEKGLRRETRAASEKVTRQVNARVNALLGRLHPSEQSKVIDAVERGQIGKLRGKATAGLGARAALRAVSPRALAGARNPDRLFIAAKMVEDDLKYLNRVGRHSGLLAGQIGRRGRTTLEGVHAQPSAGIRDEGKLKAALADAQASVRVAHHELNTAKTTKERLVAQRDVRAAEQRARNVRLRYGGTLQRRQEATTATAAAQASRQHRKATEAQGYFPRITHEEAETRGTLDRLAATSTSADVPYMQIGSNAPKVGAATQRAHRGSRAQLRAGPETAHIPERLSPNIRKTLELYGRSIGRGSSASALNTKLVRDLGEPVPGNVSKQQLHNLLDQHGKSVYRVRRGKLERLDPETHFAQIVNASKRSKTPSLTQKGTGAGGGQYAVLSDAQVQRVRKRDIRSHSTIGQLYDLPVRAFKSVALTTPAYLIRNLVGDSYNGWTDERGWRQLRNVARGQKALGALGRREKGLRKFQVNPNEVGRFTDAARRLRDVLPGDRHTVKLTTEQAAQIAKHLKLEPGQVSTRMKAETVAKLAEEMGVIRQGRFVELMEEGAGKRAAGSNAWKDVSKRVEDTNRIGTFLGGLQRGLDPREAAARASKIHFDYGDLSQHERQILRRIAPFYTFTARNLPLQVKSLARRPGKFATVAKGVEEGRRQAGLPEDYLKNLNPYELKQFGVPLRVGEKVVTASLGLPFSDLSDVFAAAGQLAKGSLTGVADVALNKIGQTAGPYKLAAELKSNYSLFYNDKISPETEPYTRAPEWAIKAAQRNPWLKRKLGIVDDYAPTDAPGAVWGWPRKIDYAFRQGQPGAIGGLIDLAGVGVKGRNAREMTEAQRWLARGAVRATTYDAKQGEINQLYDELDALTGPTGSITKLRRRLAPGTNERISKENPTPGFLRLAERESEIEKRLQALQEQTRPGGIVKGKRQTTKKPSSGGYATSSGGYASGGAGYATNSTGYAVR